jgi:hypothetical protein
MSNLFVGALDYLDYNLKEKPVKLDLSCWDMEDVVNMSFMFDQFRTLSELNLSGVKTFNVKNMRGMF